MPRICPLDPHLVNKIAAGEVIERPASVVKELLENSVDALATRIDVDVEKGGTERIRITDDGEGIPPDDLVPAVTSHSTSKVHHEEDLFRVRTMGFRGEALASIASVSRMSLRSRPPEAESGHQLEIEGGRPGTPRPCGCPVGTRIEVRRLFFNTPVRRKFLKTVGTEFGHISEQFTRIALAHPRLHLVLRHNGKSVYEVPATGELIDRLRLFYGAELAEHLIPVESQHGDVRLWGYAAHPSQSRSNRKGQYLFLNGRWIQDRSLQHALGESYRGLLMTGRHPIAFLFLEMPPELVDVNVHPTKAEVRFRDGQPLYRQLLSTLRNRFLGMDLNATMRVPPDRGGSGEAARGPEPPDPSRQRALQVELAEWAKDQLDGQQAARGETEAGSGGPEGGAGLSPPALPDGSISANTGLDSVAPPASPSREPTEDQTTPVAPSTSHVPHSTPDALPPEGRVMQIHDCYLVLETADGLTVIDQHALHERVMYEQLRQRVLSGSVESQRMLVPETIELGAREAGSLLEHRDLLCQLGFGIEEFGGNTVLLTGHPPMLARSDLAQLVRDLADRLAEAGQKPTRRDILDTLLHMMSCKAAIKAGQRLTPEEMESLIEQRHLIDDAHHCPHGRPTALVLSRAELDRQFGRQ